jgi:hypothetical protein
MVILTQEERSNHIRWIQENSDYAHATEPGRRFVIVHLAENTTTSKSGLILPSGLKEEVKIQYRNFPAQLGLVVDISDQDMINEAGIQKLNDENKPGLAIDTDRKISHGDYIRFDPMGASVFTNRYTGVEYLVIYEINVFTKIPIVTITDSSPKSDQEAFPEDPTTLEGAEELQW